jgi:hypothetical protein
MSCHYGCQINGKIPGLEEVEVLLQKSRHDDVVVASLKEFRDFKFLS